MPRRPTGTGSVVEYHGARGTVYRIRYRDADGIQHQETIGPSRREAEAALRDRLAAVERRGWRKPAPLTFRDYATTWFRQGETRRGWRTSTVLQYRTVHARLVDHLGDHPIATIRPRHVADLVEALTAAGYSPASVARDLAVLNAIFETALREELVDTNPARRAERPKPQKRRWRLLTPEEARRVDRAFAEAHEAAGEPERSLLAVYRVLFLTALGLGLRRHELLALRWRDVSHLENRLQVVRSKSAAGERSVAIPPRLATELWEHRTRTPYQGDDEHVFAHPRHGRPVDPDKFATAYRAALKRAGVEGDVRPFHDLRHASLTLGAAAGEGAVQLMARAGHANMATTKAYLHLAGTVFHDEARKLEERLYGETLSQELSQPDST